MTSSEFGWIASRTPVFNPTRIYTSEAYLEPRKAAKAAAQELAANGVIVSEIWVGRLVAQSVPSDDASACHVMFSVVDLKRFDVVGGHSVATVTM